MSSSKGVVEMDDTEINAHVGEYEDNLRKAEAAIEAALRAICPLTGEFPRYELKEALNNVQDAIRGAWEFYQD